MKDYRRTKNESVTQEDMDRIADVLDKNPKYNDWSDEEGFNIRYSEYLSGTKVDNPKTRKKVYDRYLKNPTIRGKHKRIVEFNERQEKVLRQYEKGKVPPKRVRVREKPSRKKYNYNILAKIKGKTVYTRRIKVNYTKVITKKTKTKKGNVITRKRYVKGKRYAYVTKKGYRAKKL